MAVGDLLNTRPVEITVNGRIDGQEVLNKFQYVSTVPGTPGTNTAANLLFNFRAAYRGSILPFQYQWYSVFSYVLREIGSVDKVGTPPAPTRYVNRFSTDGFGVMYGTSTDVGVLAPPLDDRLPCHETMRAFKTPSGKAFKYFKGNYNRFASYTVNEKDVTAEHWSAAQVVTWSLALNAFNATTISGNGHGGVLQLYQHAIFSSGYWYNVIRPGLTHLACSGIDSFTANKVVGTQTTRRFAPDDTFRGK